MKFNKKSLLNNKNVLRIVVFIAILNLIGYIVIKDINAVIFFLLVGFIATFYSKNMIVVSLIAIFATAIMVLIKQNTKYNEGFDDKLLIDHIVNYVMTQDDITKTTNNIYEKLKDSNLYVDKEPIRNLLTGKLYTIKNDKKLENEIKLENMKVEVNNFLDKFTKSTQLNNTKNNVTKEGLDNDTSPFPKGVDTSEINSSYLGENGETDDLLKQQKDLLVQYEKLQPSLERSYKLLNSMGGADGVQGMIEKIGGMIDKFGGMPAKYDVKE
jgi:hypothetical protein